MEGDAWKRWSAGAAFGLESGAAVIPYALLKHYRKLNLSGSEALLLIHLLSFRQVEGIEFPSLEELQAVTGRSAPVLSGELQRLMKEGFIGIEGESDELRGIHYERYDFSGLYVKLGELLAEQAREEAEARRRTLNQGAGFSGARQDSGFAGVHQGPGAPGVYRREDKPSRPSQSSLFPGDDLEEEELHERSLFSIFEKEFGRPLSPMEYEAISGWVDEDRYPEELILLALKESVFAGKVHFRYIDRILLEWSRNRVKNAQDVKAYTQKFRGGGR